MSDKLKPGLPAGIPESQYLLGRPLPLLVLSKICLIADGLKALRKVRRVWMRERHRNELKRLGNWVQQEKQHALLEQGHKHKAVLLVEVQRLRKSVLRLAKQYKQQEADAHRWVPRWSIPDGRRGVTFDPVKFDVLGSKLEGHLQHIPSFFSVEWAGNGSLTETVPRFTHRPVAKEKKALDPRLLVRGEILNDAAFKEWVLEIYETFCEWFLPTNSGRPTIRPSLLPGQLTRRVKPKQYTLQVVNHYIPGLSLTEGYLDELLKPIPLGPQGEPSKPDSVQTAPDPLPDESTTTNPNQRHSLIDKTEEIVRKKNRARTAHRVTT